MSAIERKNKDLTNPQNKVLCFQFNRMFSIKLPSATAFLQCFAFFHFSSCNNPLSWNVISIIASF